MAFPVHLSPVTRLIKGPWTAGYWIRSHPAETLSTTGTTPPTRLQTLPSSLKPTARVFSLCQLTPAACHSPRSSSSEQRTGLFASMMTSTLVTLVLTVVVSSLLPAASAFGYNPTAKLCLLNSCSPRSDFPFIHLDCQLSCKAAGLGNGHCGSRPAGQGHGIYCFCDKAPENAVSQVLVGIALGLECETLCPVACNICGCTTGVCSSPYQGVYYCTCH